VAGDLIGRLFQPTGEQHQPKRLVRKVRHRCRLQNHAGIRIKLEHGKNRAGWYSHPSGNEHICILRIPDDCMCLIHARCKTGNDRPPVFLSLPAHPYDREAGRERCAAGTVCRKKITAHFDSHCQCGIVVVRKRIVQIILPGDVPLFLIFTILNSCGIPKRPAAVFWA
jgi:hypothetical protein